MLYFCQHGAVDYFVKWEKFDLALEYSQGLDLDYAMNTKYHTKGYSSRLDYTIKPQSLSLQLQYDQYNDGRPNVKDEKSLSTGLQVFIHAQPYIRIGYMYNRLGLPSWHKNGMIDNAGFTQLYLPL
jgi:hypothetical protein